MTSLSLMIISIAVAAGLLTWWILSHDRKEKNQSPNTITKETA